MIFIEEQTKFTDKQKLNMLVESCCTEEERGYLFIFESFYDEENNTIELYNFSFNEYGILLEENINQKELHIPLSRPGIKPRYVMITGAGSHAGRMKVSLHGVKINPKNKDKYITIYRKRNDENEYEGNLRNIKMDSKELEIYNNLFDRNKELIQYVVTSKDKINGWLIDDAFIKDEEKRMEGYEVKRDSITGNAEIMLNGKLIDYVDIAYNSIK